MNAKAVAADVTLKLRELETAQGLPEDVRGWATEARDLVCSIMHWIDKQDYDSSWE